MLYNILLAFMILVCALMVVVILLQRSEGGALGMGGGTSGFMTARGAGNLLTRITWILAGLFFVCAIVLILEGNRERRSATFEQLKVTPMAPGAALPAQRPAATQPSPAQNAPDLGDLESPASKAAAPAAAPTLRPAAPTVRPAAPAASQAPAATPAPAPATSAPAANQTPSATH